MYSFKYIAYTYFKLKTMIMSYVLKLLMKKTRTTFYSRLGNLTFSKAFCKVASVKNKTNI